MPSTINTAASSLPSSMAALLALMLLLNTTSVSADLDSALLAMEDSNNPLFLVNSSSGAIYLELFPIEAPANVAHFMALAEGELEFVDTVANTRFTPRYYDGMRFHRVIPGFAIQAGSPHHHPLGSPAELLNDEINASALNLDRLPILAEDGSINPILNVGSQTEFGERVLRHIYRERGIDSVAELQDQQSDVVVDLQGLTVMRLYEYEGYTYQNEYPTRPIERGTIALANDGPDRNGPEFFIALADSEWLNGRYTVIGRVIEGMEVADQIGRTAIEPEAFDLRSTTIYSIRRMN